MDETRDPNWYKEAVGGMWEEIGRLQCDHLITQGLQPHHFLLDIGCGSLRGGLHFIRYLEPGHYYGMDASRELLEAGRHELEINGLAGKNPILVENAEFEFSLLNRTFDFALAHSLFTHLPLNSILRCLMNVEKVLVPGARLFATIFENPQGKFNLDPLQVPRVDGPEIVTFLEKDPYHYDFETFRWLCKGTYLRVRYIGEWNHPRGQRLIVFTRSRRRVYSMLKPLVAKVRNLVRGHRDA